MPDPTPSANPDPATVSAADSGVINSLSVPAATTGDPDTPTHADAATASARRYELGGEIARGGMGAVYRATDTAFGREVAVKVLLGRYAPTSGTARRFADEARITGQLQHPNIPAVHDLGTLPDGRPFLAMKLIKGDTLDELLKSRPDPSADRGRFVAAFEQVCQAVAYAHAHNVIHRDLKPGNVMVGAFGEVQVMDWGLAKVLGTRDAEPTDPDETAAPTAVHSIRQTDSAFTQAGSVLGTPAYMPPEQAVGAIHKVDARSDVFGLGAILAVILTGKPPFVGSSAETTRLQAAQGDVEECSARLDASGAEPELVALCKRCLSKKPGDRPADAGEVATAVAALRAAADERARRAELDRVKAEGDKVTAEVQAAEQRKRRRVQLALALAIGLLVAGGGAAGWWRNRVASERDRVGSERRADDLQRRLEDGRRAAAEGERAARNEEAVAALLDRCDEALRANDTGRAALALEAAEKRATDGLGEALSARLVRRRADLGVSRELDEVDQFRWTLAESEASKAALATKHRLAFARFSGDPDLHPTPALARRVTDSVIHARLVTNLDRFLRNAPAPNLRGLLRAVDPDPYRDAIRDAVLAENSAELAALAVKPDALEQPTEFLSYLGESQRIPADRRRELLRIALARTPGDLALLMAMGGTYRPNSSLTANERVRWYAAATAVAPANIVALHNLGNGLTDLGDFPGAVWAYRRAADLDRRNAWPHIGLGNVHAIQGNTTAAATEAETAIRLAAANTTALTLAYTLSGVVSRDRRDPAGAYEAFRRALELDPKSPWALLNMGRLRFDAGDVDGAIRFYTSSLDQDAGIGPTHNALGYALYTKGEPDRAIDSYRRAIAVDPRNPYPHFNAGLAYQGKGELDRAIAFFEAALSRDPDLQGAKVYLLQLRTWKDLLPRLPEIADGRAEPRTPAAALDYAELCRQPFQKRYLAAVRLYRTALTGDPKAAEIRTPERTLIVRYNAACAAALALAGRGVDAGSLTAAGRTALHAEARAWLRADLGFYRRSVSPGEPADRAVVVKAVSDLLTDPDFLGVRPGLARLGLAANERAEWDKLWAEAKTTLANAQKPLPRELLPAPRQE